MKYQPQPTQTDVNPFGQYKLIHHTYLSEIASVKNGGVPLGQYSIAHPTNIDYWKEGVT